MSKALENNNPGNLKYVGQQGATNNGGFAKFSTPDDGYIALMNDLHGKLTGATSTGLTPTSTLSEFASKYAPSSENDTDGYVLKLANQLKVSPDTKLQALQSRVPDLANAIAQNEDVNFASKYKINVPQDSSQGYNPTPFSNPDQESSLGTLGSASQQPQDNGAINGGVGGVVQGIARGLASPFLRMGANLENAYKMSQGQQVDPNAPVNVLGNNAVNDYFGAQTPIGQKQGDFAGNVKDALGIGLQAASSVAVPELGGALKGATVGGKILSGALTGAKVGATGGAMYGAGNALSENKGVLGTLGDTAVGAATGGIGGGALGGLLAGPMAIKNKIWPSDNTIIQNRTQALNDVVGNNSPLRNLVENGKKNGIDIPTFVGEQNLLTDAVDKNGTIHTLQSGGAVDQMQEFMKPIEATVGQSLEREGKYIPMTDLATELENKIRSSGLHGDTLTSALEKAQKELAGYQSEVVGGSLGQQYGKDNIPLSLLHYAKAQIYAQKSNAYLNPQSSVVEKTIAKALKDIIEKHSELPVEKLNGELAKYIAVTKFLKKLDGKKAIGGRLGKYFAETLGGIVGNSVVGPVGGIAGVEAAGKIHGNMMENTFSGGGILKKTTANKLEASDLIKNTAAEAKTPRPTRGLLSAPKTPEAPQVAIPLKGKTLPSAVMVHGKKAPISWEQAINRKVYEQRKGMLPTKQMEQANKIISVK